MTERILRACVALGVVLLAMSGCTKLEPTQSDDAEVTVATDTAEVEEDLTQDTPELDAADQSPELDLAELADLTSDSDVVDAEADVLVADVDADDLLADACLCTPLTYPVCDSATQQTYENPCQADCAGVLSFTAGACAADCVNYCTPDDLLETPRCGSDGLNYTSTCSLLCDSADCIQSGTCPTLFYPGSCDDLCVVAETTRVEVGSPVPTFACNDVNPNSPLQSQGLTDVFLKQQVWIAYFGSCT